MTGLEHYVVRTVDYTEPFGDRTLCVDVWRMLSEKFPEAWACVLMPDHIHLIAGSGRLGELGRLMHLSGPLRMYAWSEVASRGVIPNKKHLMRLIKYVHLNPCRDGLATCPLGWEFSTHRDYMGLVHSPWPKVARYLEVLGQRNAQEFHRLVSSDQTTSIDGTSPPHWVERNSMLVGTSAQIVRSVAQALRLDRADPKVRRACVEVLYRRLDWSGKQVGQVLGISESAVRQIAWRLPSRLLLDTRMLQTYLRDPRLLG